MFKPLIRELKKLGRGVQISIPIGPDEDGYIDKQCPAEQCLFHFKVLESDWNDLFKDEAVYCPRCRHEANSDSWWTEQQVENAEQQAYDQITAGIDEAFQKGAREFNRRQPRNSFVSISVSYSGKQVRQAIVPISALEVMVHKAQCEKCEAKFAVIGIAYFCPCCGHNSVERMFDDSMTKVLVKLDNLGTIQKALLSSGQKDEYAITCQSLLESGVQDCVVAFQRLAEELYKRIPNIPEAPFNAFQRLKQANQLWHDAIGQNYEDWISESDMNFLNIMYQKRHLLAHTEGIVDSKYVATSGDTNYRTGQRIVINENEVRNMVGIVGQLAKELRTRVSSIVSTV